MLLPCTSLFVVSYVSSFLPFFLPLGFSVAVEVWLLPWAAELHCRCGPSSPTAILATQQGSSFFTLATSNKCIASSNKCRATSNKKLLGAPGIATSNNKLLELPDPDQKTSSRVQSPDVSRL